MRFTHINLNFQEILDFYKMPIKGKTMRAKRQHSNGASRGWGLNTLNSEKCSTKAY